MLTSFVLSFFLAQANVTLPDAVTQSRENALEQREDFRTNIEAKRQELRDQLETHKQEVKEMRDEFHQKASDIRARKEEELKQRQEELKQKIADRLDERRAKIVERLSEQVNAINDKITDGYLKHLDVMVNILDKMVARADKLEEQGLDVSVARMELSGAYASVNDIRNKVLVQKEKIYSVADEDVEVIGQKMSSTIHELRADLGTLRDEMHSLLKNVLNVLKNIAQTMAQTSNENNGTEEGETNNNTTTSTNE